MSTISEVRWIAQACKKNQGYDDWMERPDVVYSGWFAGDGRHGPAQNMIEHFDAVKQRETWLKWRLIQEVRTIRKEVVR